MADVLLWYGDGRINTKLISYELEPMDDLVTGLSDGVKLIQLLVSRSIRFLPRFNYYLETGAYDL
jgi:hypothetical protein